METQPKPNANKEEDEEEAFSYAMQLVSGIALNMSLQSAIELGVFDIIAKAGPTANLSASEIASHMSSVNKDAPIMLDRILWLLATHRVVNCSVVVGSENLYSLTPASKYFVRDQNGVSLGSLMALAQDKVFLESWFQLKDAVLEGGVPFDRVHGTNAFDYPGVDSRFNEVFNKAMYNHTTIVIKKILEVYRGFENLKQLVDVGGGLGVTLKAVTTKYPHIKAINFDLPHVIQHASHSPGVEHVGGDMFESVPESEAIFLKWILHDWSDEHCLRLLKNCYKAIPDDGKVIVVEAIVPEIPEASAAAKTTSQIDVIMMTQNPGGKERTRQEFTSLATGAGFSGIRFDCFACNFCVMELYK
ncbi:hypothetical protein Q3G72_025554 [Acer saccharum]|nr:hypothetical protein Q3G72_025554 [Acer saccharum]